MGRRLLTWWSSALMLAIVPFEHELYHVWDGDPGWRAQWAQWTCGHLAGLAMALLLIPRFLALPGAAQWVGVAACAWMALEDAQAAFCGALHWGAANVPTASRLCVERFGDEPYVVAAAAGVATMLVAVLRLGNSGRKSDDKD